MKMNNDRQKEIDTYLEMLRDIDNDSKAMKQLRFDNVFRRLKELETRLERLENLYNGTPKD